MYKWGFFSCNFFAFSAKIIASLVSCIEQGQVIVSNLGSFRDMIFLIISLDWAINFVVFWLIHHNELIKSLGLIISSISSILELSIIDNVSLSKFIM